jgi:hypothetical protein
VEKEKWRILPVGEVHDQAGRPDRRPPENAPQESMLFCLFKHTAAQAVRDLNCSSWRTNSKT